jgi:hypothetical protein
MESFSSSTALPTPSPAPSDARPQARFRPTKRIHGVEWLAIDHTANQKRGSKISGIWDHGGEYININNPGGAHRWICDLCNKDLSLTGSTSNILRHLLKRHKIRVVEVDPEAQDLSDEEEASLISQNSSLLTSYLNQVDIERFRELLVRWIVQCQIPFRAIQRSQFSDLLLCAAPSLKSYLASSPSTIKSWVLNDYLKAFEQVKSRLSDSNSKIHLSFDIWTSPSCSAIIAVCAHFLGKNLRLCHPLLAMKEISGHQEGEAIAEVLKSVIDQWGLRAEQLGVWVGDNAGNVDTAIKVLVRDLLPQETYSRRSRCLGHIINLAAKAFLLGKDCEACEEEEAIAEQRVGNAQQLATQQRRWRERGPVGKFHNVVAFIRASPQRRNEFGLAVKTVIATTEANGKCSEVQIKVYPGWVNIVPWLTWGGRRASGLLLLYQPYT